MQRENVLTLYILYLTLCSVSFYHLLHKIFQMSMEVLAECSTVKFYNLLQDIFKMSMDVFAECSTLDFMVYYISEMSTNVFAECSSVTFYSLCNIFLMSKDDFAERSTVWIYSLLHDILQMSMDILAECSTVREYSLLHDIFQMSMDILAECINVRVYSLLQFTFKVVLFLNLSREFKFMWSQTCSEVEHTDMENPWKRIWSQTVRTCFLRAWLRLEPTHGRLLVSKSWGHKLLHWMSQQGEVHVHSGKSELPWRISLNLNEHERFRSTLNSWFCTFSPWGLKWYVPETNKTPKHILEW